MAYILKFLGTAIFVLISIIDVNKFFLKTCYVILLTLSLFINRFKFLTLTDIIYSIKNSLH